jgi:tetratricopeptide (TPR) repeat protein
VPYIKGKVTDLKEKSRCYNNIAMVQLQLGLTEDAVKYFDKQLNLTPDDYLLRFTVLQNIVDFTNTSLQNDTAAMAYCLRGLNYLLTLDPVRTDKELTYTINFDKVILLMGVKNYKDAYSVLKSSGMANQQNNFTHWLLESRLYLEIDSTPSFISLTQKMAHNMEKITPLQSAEFGTLLAEWGMKYANKYAEAEKEYNEAIVLFPSDWTYALRLAQIYEHQSKDNEAFALLELIILMNFLFTFN